MTWEDARPNTHLEKQIRVNLLTGAEDIGDSKPFSTLFLQLLTRPSSLRMLISRITEEEKKRTFSFFFFLLKGKTHFHP